MEGRKIMLKFLSTIRSKTDSLEQESIALVFVLALALYFSFGFYHLTKFDTADEHFWIDQDRISQYWNAVEKQDWKKTRINNKPGITLAYVSGIGLIFDKNHSNQIKERGDVFTEYNSREFQRINFLYRFPLLIFNGLFSFFFFWVIKKLTENAWIGLWTAALILLSPIILGISQIVNPDSLSWLFCSAAIFSFLLFLKNGLKKTALLAALFLGMALATKYIALILVYFFFFIFLSRIIFSYEKEKENPEAFSRKILKQAGAYLAIVGGGFLIFSVLMPAVFMKSKYLFNDIINFNNTGFIFWTTICADILIILDAYFLRGRAILFFLKYLSRYKNIFFRSIIAAVFGICFFTLINWTFGFNFFNLDSVPFDSRQSDFFMSLAFWKKIILQARPLVFSLTPAVLILTLFIWIKIIFKKTRYDFFIYALSAFVLIYWVAVTIQNLLVNIRYGIILQPLVIFLSVLGLWEILNYKAFLKVNKIIISLVIIFASTVSLWLIKPFYFNYANDLLPKNNLIASAWGYGGYEAGEFINSAAGGQKSVVIADYPGVCPFIFGQCVDISNDNRKKVIEVLNKNQNDVYFVLTRRGQIRWGYIGQFIEAAKNPPLWELNIDNRPENFVRAYKQN